MNREFQLSWPNPLPLFTVQGRLVVLLPDVMRRPRRIALTEAVLGALAEDRIDALVIDASGVAQADGQLCGAILRMGVGARDQGVPVILCGLTPYIVATLRTMGFPFVAVSTTGSLGSGLELARLRAAERRTPASR